MLRKIFYFLILVVVVLGILAVVFSSRGKKIVRLNLPKVGVSIYPLALVLNEIAQDKIEIVFLAENQGVHEVTLRPKIAKSLSEAKGLLVTGYEIDVWAERLGENLGLRIVRVNEKAPKILTKEGYFNPHIWLSFSGLKGVAESILSFLISIDEANREFYEENYDRFINEISLLEKEYKEKFQELHNIPFISYHDAFEPLFLELGLNYKGSLVVGERSLTPQEVTKLQEEIKKSKIKIIFKDSYETSPKLLNFAKENELDIKFLDPIENGKIEKGEILRIFKNNLETIYQTLKNESIGS
jgi:zinc transport system substrate-binding protein